MSLVWHSRDQVLATPVPRGLHDWQDSFRAILDHPSVTPCCLCSLPPHAVAGSWLHFFRWAEHPTSHPSRLYGRMEKACFPNYLKELWWHTVTSGCPTRALHWRALPLKGKQTPHHKRKQVGLRSACSHRPGQELKAHMKAEIWIPLCYGRSWILRLDYPKDNLALHLFRTLLQGADTLHVIIGPTVLGNWTREARGQINFTGVREGLAGASINDDFQSLKN